MSLIDNSHTHTHSQNGIQYATVWHKLTHAQ